ncbi:MAG: hypothetical protein ICV72_10795 [Aldersonia sp.]|nr:hypothetical protein [Aldersonia sp.]
MFDEIVRTLDPVLTPLGFATAQCGAGDEQGQVIYCRGDVDSTDGGCVDLVIDLVSTPDWRITDVRYWGFPSARWHLDFDADGDLVDQLAGLARTLPITLS